MYVITTCTMINNINIIANINTIMVTFCAINGGTR